MKVKLITIMFLFTIFTSYAQGMADRKAVIKPEQLLVLTETELLRLKVADCEIVELRSQFKKIEEETLKQINSIFSRKKADFEKIEKRLRIKLSDYTLMTSGKLIKKKK